MGETGVKKEMDVVRPRGIKGLENSRDVIYSGVDFRGERAGQG